MQPLKHNASSLQWCCPQNFLWKGGIDHSSLILPDHRATDWRVLNILHKPITRYHDNPSPSMKGQIFGMALVYNILKSILKYLVLRRLWVVLPGTTSRQLRSISGLFIDKRFRVKIIIHLSSHDLCKVADLHILVAFLLLLFVFYWEIHQI